MKQPHITRFELEQIVEANRHFTTKGELAAYIPELKRANTDALGLSVATQDGEVISVGDCGHQFTMQSISKVISLLVALNDYGFDHVFSRVGMEPSGEPFNSISKLETVDSHIPLNPMINAGAIAIASMIKGKDVSERFNRIASFVKTITDTDRITINEDVYKSERETGDRNRSLAYFMKSTKVIDSNVEEALDLYFRLCSINITCSDLARIGLFLSNGGLIPRTNERLIDSEITRMVMTIMFTAGMYDESGESAMRTGIPAKSGVSGGILAVAPRKVGIGVIGPAINKTGNSIAGLNVVEDVSRRFGLHLLASGEELTSYGFHHNHKGFE